MCGREGKKGTVTGVARSKGTGVKDGWKKGLNEEKKKGKRSVWEVAGGESSRRRKRNEMTMKEERRVAKSSLNRKEGRNIDEGGEASGENSRGRKERSDDNEGEVGGEEQLNNEQRKG